MTEAPSDRIVVLLRSRPRLRIYEIAEALGLGTRLVEGHLRELERAGRVRRVEDAEHIVGWEAVP